MGLGCLLAVSCPPCEVNQGDTPTLRCVGIVTEEAVASLLERTQRAQEASKAETRGGIGQ